jgi:glycosyltransferase involved in cell wall biosynthesis
MIKIVSSNLPRIPTPPIFYGGAELEAALIANALLEAGFSVCLDANPRSLKTWDYYFTTSIKLCNGKADLTISAVNCDADIHVLQGAPLFCPTYKVFISEPQKEYYNALYGLDNDHQVIPNAIPEWLYTPRERWDDGDYYLFMNRCDESKGCEEFVDWCIKNNYKCKMITQNWFVRSPAYTQRVLDKARNHGIEVLINVDPLDKIEIIKGAKAVVGFLSPKYFEGYGLWVHEANWLRVPVIATPRPAVPWTMMRGVLIDGSKITEVNKDEIAWRRERSYASFRERWVKLVEQSF